MASEVVRLLSIDPGLSQLGWSVSDYKLTTGKLVVHRFGGISATKLVNRADRKDEVRQFGKRVVSLNIIRSSILNLIEEYKPDYLVIEDAFYNPQFPNAYVALVQVITTIELLGYRKYNKVLFKIPPRSAKLAISGFGGSGKLNIQSAILTSDKIEFKQKRQTEGLTEHEADAIAIGWTFCINILPSILNNESTLFV